MNNIDEYTVEELWVDKYDSHNTRCENISTRVYDMGVVANNPQSQTVHVSKPYQNYFIQGDFQGKDLNVLVDIQPGMSPPTFSFFDLVVQSTTIDTVNPNYGEAPGTINIYNDIGTILLGSYIINEADFRTNVIRCARNPSSYTHEWRTYLMNDQ